ncbi:ECF transporter S component [Arthrobacter sp. SDTb3-6]|uniref:ECF transporter S component n=1 Tax=Arthrobacter sp. SDTb3-6 TaxID=2713571 RepID=UPI00159E0550|nr:ECF transporter S component [Arthrobacter sp. SDTb3-6]NVN00417.1 ECF transporter S component [Arthrobacter sp. SDTb3-6]
MKHKKGFSALMRSYGRLTIFMIPIGIATNFIGGQIAILLKLPMYLDSIGTILVGALCGGLPGALVGTISNLINSITSPTLAPYATLSILFGFLAGWLSKHGVFKSLWKTLLASIPFALIGSILGGLITIWVFGGLGGSGGALIVGALVAAGMDLNAAVFTAAIPMDFLDKIPTVLVVFLILKRIPTRLFVKLPLGYVYLNKAKTTSTTSAVNPVDDEDDELALG